MIIGFIGVGFMGSGMARNLLAAGHALRILVHRRRDRVEALCRDGAREVSNLQALADGADAVFLCLPNAEAVRQVVADLLPALSRGSLLVDTSTSLPEVSADLAGVCADNGVDFLDAPVNGGPDQARHGHLGSMVGGSEAAFERARPVLEAYSRTVVRFGGPGAGNTAKLINNFITLGQVGLIVEAFRRCDRMGLDRRALYELLRGGAANSGTLEKMLPGALAGTYDGHKFSLGNATKDARYAACMVADLGEQSNFAGAIERFFEQEFASHPAETILSELLRQ